MSGQGALWDNIDAVNGAAQQGRKDYKCTCNSNSTAEGTAAAQTDSCIHLALPLVNSQPETRQSKYDNKMHFKELKNFHFTYLNVSYCYNYNNYTIAHNFEEEE